MRICAEVQLAMERLVRSFCPYSANRSTSFPTGIRTGARIVDERLAMCVVSARRANPKSQSCTAAHMGEPVPVYQQSSRAHS